MILVISDTGGQCMKTRLPLPGQLKLKNKGVNSEVVLNIFIHHCTLKLTKHDQSSHYL